MRDIYRTGMSDEVFAWTASSNNQAFVAGRLSVALNAISIVRTAEDSGNKELSDDTWLASIPRGPAMRMGNEHVMGVYVIWKFAKNKAAAKKFLVGPAARVPLALRSEQVLQLPSVDGIHQGRVQDHPPAHCAGHPQAQGEVHRAGDDRGEVHDEPGTPRLHDAGHGRDLQHVPDPADVRRGSAGETEPLPRRSTPSRKAQGSTASGRTRGSSRSISCDAAEVLEGPRHVCRVCADRRMPPA